MASARQAAKITFNLPEDPGQRELLEWWLTTAYDDWMKTAPKAAEYGGRGQGSADLRLIGDNLAELLNWEDVPNAVKMEMGCWLYLQGKVARMVSNYQQQRPAKPDTLLDTTVYAMMMRRIQKVQQWP